jgi:hypothetical protein
VARSYVESVRDRLCPILIEVPLQTRALMHCDYWPFKDYYALPSGIHKGNAGIMLFGRNSNRKNTP